MACVTSIGLAGMLSDAPLEAGSGAEASEIWIRLLKSLEKFAGVSSVKDGFTEERRNPICTLPPASAPISRRSMPNSHTRCCEQLIRNGKRVKRSDPSAKKQPKPGPRLDRSGGGCRPVHVSGPR